MNVLSVSCVIPVHNGERYLTEAIESVLGQSVPASEIIIVDDGSTDASARIAQRFRSRVRYEFQEHRGVSAARNRGICLAQSELVCLLDADDVYIDRKLEAQTERFRCRPELEFCSALTENFWSPDIPPRERDHQSAIGLPWPQHLSTWIFRRSLYVRVGGFDETMPLSQDVDWHLRVVRDGAIRETVPLVLSRRRLHAGNRTRLATDMCRAAVVECVYRNVVMPRRKPTQ